ncbi:MAG: PqqD family protein [Thermoanaerobaculia bacterium]|nr:PqqD family protein [Thermoanaerobaculia bacterium]
MPLRINSPTVVGQVIDGEAVVINLQTGAYYSLVGSAAAIWEALERELPPALVRESLEARFSTSGDEIDRALEEFVEVLRGEGLVVDSVGAPSAGGEASATLPPPSARTAFEPPVLAKFTDMQELLLLDPIHDTDDAGWPQPAGRAEP